MPLQATSGAASYEAFGGGVPFVPTYIEDVFSTYLYTGNGSTQTINNGIDLAGKGGLWWGKQRNSTGQHWLLDSARAGNIISTNLTDAQTVAFASSPFTSTGISFTSANSIYNGNGNTYVGGTFRKQPKFFDVVTYTGDGIAGRTVAHSLGSTPGFMIVKCTSSTTNWFCWHRDMPNTNVMRLNATLASYDDTTAWNSTSPTSTNFTVGTSVATNASGATYVAYLFAHNAGGFGLTGTDNVISCGSGSWSGGSDNVVNLGYEVQWLMYKRTDDVSNWMMWDTMRGMSLTASEFLRANLADAAVTYNSPYAIYPTATGFTVPAGVLNTGNYIYIAIRRGPMKVPTDGTKVFSPVARTGTGSATTQSTGLNGLDLAFTLPRNAAGNNWLWVDRLRGGVAGSAARIQSNTTTQEFADGAMSVLANIQDQLTYNGGGANQAGQAYIVECFKRAPGFFDEVCYTGNGPGTQVVSHNLTVAPELVINKTRSTSNGWTVFQGSTTALTGFLRLNDVNGQGGDTLNVSSTTVTVDSTIGFGMNTSGVTYVTYLFASCPGVSKVGRYTGTGTTQVINCGFAAGSRFVMIKRWNSTGPWYIWDSARGIVAGNDPYLLLNSTDAEVTSTDYVDTAATGFEISSTAPAEINASGGTFIFLAIA